MKASELRVGNIVNDEENTTMYVAGVWPVDDGKQYNFIDSADNSGNVNILSGIPLTEEWLFKLQFEKTSGRHGDYYFHIVFKGMRIWVDNITGKYTLGRKSDPPAEGRYNTYWIKGGINYVHQLQNLFYALTDQELEVKS